MPSLYRNHQFPRHPMQQSRIFIRQLRLATTTKTRYANLPSRGRDCRRRQSCTVGLGSLRRAPRRGLSFRPSKTYHRLKSLITDSKGQPPGPRIHARRGSEVVATSGVLVNRREVVGNFDKSATLELHARSRQGRSFEVE